MLANIGARADGSGFTAGSIGLRSGFVDGSMTVRMASRMGCGPVVS